MLLILKTIRDRAISGKYWTPWVLRTTPLLFSSGYQKRDLHLILGSVKENLCTHEKRVD